VDLALRDYVRTSGHRVIGLGSWVTGSGYRCPLSSPDPSDHDMTPLFDAVTEPELLCVAWRSMQVFLRDRIVALLRRRLPRLHAGEIALVLRSVNVYPPEELLRDITDADGACSRFDRLGLNPNLGDGQVDGLWGAGGRSFLASCAWQAGVLYCRDRDGQVQRHRAMPGRLLAGAGRLDFQATVTLCRQFLDKARQAMLEGRGAETCKNIRRLGRYLRKAERESGIDAAWLGKLTLHELVDEAQALEGASLEALQGWLSGQRHRLAEVFAQAGTEISCLQDMAAAGGEATEKFHHPLRDQTLRLLAAQARARGAAPARPGGEQPRGCLAANVKALASSRSQTARYLPRTLSAWPPLAPGP